MPVGDAQAPFLFITTLYYAMRFATKNEKNIGFTLEGRGSHYPEFPITDTDFADDLALVSKTSMTILICCSTII